MIKKLLLIFISVIFFVPFAYSADKYSKEYLQSKKHISLTSPAVQKIVERAIKKELKRETGAKFDVSFKGYNTSSMKKGIFKYLELAGKDAKIDDIPVPYVHLISLSDYNYIDYTKHPMEYKSDMKFAFEMELSEESINSALKNKKYQKEIDKVNQIAYPLFVINEVKTKIADNRLYVIMYYNFPITVSKRDKTFIASTELKVEKGEIKAKDVKIDSKYGNLGLNRVANLLNLLNPLEFTLKLMDSKNCKGNIENVNIVDNNIKVDGKIFVSKDEK